MRWLARGERAGGVGAGFVRCHQCSPKRRRVRSRRRRTGGDRGRALRGIGHAGGRGAGGRCEDAGAAQEIEGLRAQVRGGAAQLRAALTAAEEKYVAALAARDRAYAQEIAVFRAAVEDIAKTPEGVAALARFNAGDEIGALAVLDDLRAARDAARKKRDDIESAAEGRRIATLALEARAKGKLTTAQVIARFEEVTRLDPGVFWDWVDLPPIPGCRATAGCFACSEGRR